MSRQGSSGRMPIEQGWPIAVRNAAGFVEHTGWRVVEVWDDGVVAVRMADGVEGDLSWDVVFADNPDFSLDGPADLPPASFEPPPAVDPAPDPEPASARDEPAAATASTYVVPVRETAPPPRPQAPVVEVAPLRDRLLNRPVNVPRSNGTVDKAGWHIADVDEEGVLASQDQQGVDKRLTWGLLVTHNPDLLPLNAKIKMLSGAAGYFKGIEDGMAAVEGHASHIGTGMQRRSFFQQTLLEPLDAFAARNRDRFGLT